MEENNKSITFVFPQELSLEQEEMFIQQFQNILNGGKKRLEHSLKFQQHQLYSIAGSILGETRMMNEAMKIQLTRILNEWNTIMVLEKLSPGTYKYTVRNEYFKMFELEISQLQVRTGFWPKFSKELIKVFERESFRKMGFLKDQVHVLVKG